MKILFLTPYPLKESPSQRFRFEQYFTSLQDQGHSYHVQSFLDAQNWRLFFHSTNLWAKIAALVKGFTKRVHILFYCASYDCIFIHREVTPLGPPIFEWLITRSHKRKVIYDFDDAIWMTDRSNESWMLRTIKWRSKVKSICRWSDKVSCGNDYLVSYARQFNNSVFYNPTTVDTDTSHNPELHAEQNSDFVTIGWTGSHSTLKYITQIERVLQRIEQQFPRMRFLVIADKPALLNLKSLQFIPWSLQTEISDLYKIDIGIMPLPDDEWSKGKCGFKAIQFMSLKIPVVTSPVGVNSTIVDHGMNGFLAASEDEWVNFLFQLINDKQQRIAFGQHGRKKIIEFYSVQSNKKNFVGLFEF